MSTAGNNLSIVKGSTTIKSKEDTEVGIVWAEWNEEVTGKLRDGAINTLLNHGVKRENINIKAVPGTFELVAAAKWMAEYSTVDAVICIGVVIQGDTRHFDFICGPVAQGLINLNIEFEIPFIFGVLTTNDLQQAIDRAGGKHGNKGDEAAITALKMIALQEELLDEDLGFDEDELDED